MRARLLIITLTGLLTLSGAALAVVVADIDPLIVPLAGGSFLAGALLIAANEYLRSR